MPKPSLQTHNYKVVSADIIRLIETALLSDYTITVGLTFLNPAGLPLASMTFGSSATLPKKALTKNLDAHGNLVAPGTTARVARLDRVSIQRDVGVHRYGDETLLAQRVGTVDQWAVHVTASTLPTPVQAFEHALQAHPR